MSWFRAALLAGLALGLGSCATFTEGSRQLIAISTPPTNSAFCVLTRGRESWMVTTPGVLRIDKSGSDLAIHCSHPGYQDAYSVIPAELEGWTLGNLATGGVTAGLDAATGAMFRYPDTFKLAMIPAPVSRAPVPTVAPVPVQPVPVPAEPEPAPEPVTPPPDDKPLPGTLPQNF